MHRRSSWGWVSPLIMVVAAGLWHSAQLMCSHLSEGVSQGRSGRGSTSSRAVTRLRYEMKQQQLGHGQKELRHLLGKGEREGKNKQLQVLWWWQGDVCTHKCILTQLHNTNTSTPLKTCLLLLLPFCLIHVEGRFGITALRELG